MMLFEWNGYRCKYCKKDLTGKQRSWCSDRHRYLYICENKVELDEKECESCGGSFIPVTSGKKYCCVPCQNRARNKRAQEKLKRLCVVCDSPYIPHKTSGNCCDLYCRKINKMRG